MRRRGSKGMRRRGNGGVRSGSRGKRRRGRGSGRRCSEGIRRHFFLIFFLKKI